MSRQYISCKSSWKMNEVLKKYLTLVFSIICATCIYFLSSWHCFSTPLWLLQGDPSSAYMLNGLNVSLLQSVGHIDHPGTTVQILCAIFLRLLWLVGPGEGDFATSILRNYEWYLRYVLTGFFFLQSCIVTTVSLWIWKKFHNIALLLVMSVAILASPQVLAMEAQSLRPEILIPLLHLLLAVCTLARLDEEYQHQDASTSLAFWTGALACTAFFTKLTCVPLFAMTFFLWSSWNYWRFYGIGFLCVIIICLPFIFPSVHQLIRWIFDLAVHSGHYGSGETNVINPQSFFKNLILITKLNYIYLLLLLVELVYCIYIYKCKCSFTCKVVYLYLFSISLTILLIAKHFSMHYMLAVYLPILLISFIFIAISTHGIVKYIGCTIYVIFIYISLNHLILFSNKDQYQNVIKYSQEYSDNNTITSYNSFTIPYVLSFGNDFAHHSFTDILEKIYPEHYMYNIWSQKFYQFNRDVTLKINEMISSGRKLYIRGTHLGTAQCQYLLLGKKLVQTPLGEQVYELLGIKD